ncbi:MAG: flagellar export protein FliJ [Lachnospiraceae bacterium]|nr:flagellar export protein FliJ [Lachnospiraceae bacterium]MDE6698263.1 flagellar export protein FliJ [Lachnospiraceae bacterium]
MVKFRYKMQNILDLKEKMEEQAKTEFSARAERLRQEELKLTSIYDDISKYEDRIRSMNNERIDILELKQCNNAINIKQQQAETQQKVIVMAEKDVDIARGKLNQVMVDRKTQEILKEKAFEEYKKELEAEENKEIDEVVSFQYNNVRQ